MKKFITGVILASFVFVGPATTYAVTASTTVSSQVQSLLTQIQNLQAQLKTLQDLQAQINTAKSSVTSTLTLINSLREGMSGDDVTTLQTILASDSTIYPEGIISGYYGKLTSEAIKRFQKKHGIEALGLVGPKTLTKLNEWIKSLGLHEETATSTTPTATTTKNKHGKVLCIPPGHLIAPGWLKHNQGVSTSTVPICNNKYDDDDDDNHYDDVTAPVIYGVNTSALKATTTDIVWATNESSNSKVWFGTSNPLTLTSSAFVSLPSYVISHSVSLSGLATSTTYYYVVVSADAKGNIATSTQSSFTTLAQYYSDNDVTAPIISNGNTSALKATTTDIVWTTNELSDSKVWFGTSSPFTLASSAFVKSSTLVLNHVVSLTGLATSTLYNYIIVSADAKGNVASSTEASFTTLAQ